MRYCNRSMMQGYTLLELMIVVAVVSIIAAIAYPTYQDAVRKANRTEGKNALLDAAAREERYYSDNNIFDALATVGIGSSSENGRYDISIGNLGGDKQTYTLTAAPTFTDAACGNLTLTHAGVKGVSGTAGVNTCWAR